MSDKDRRTEELLVERALRPLDDGENWELDQLGAEDDDSYDLALAAVALATLPIEPMPRQVAERVLRTSQEFTAMKSLAGLELPASMRQGEIRTLPGVALPTAEKPPRRPSVAPAPKAPPDEVTVRRGSLARLPHTAPEEEQETHRRGVLPKSPPTPREQPPELEEEETHRRETLAKSPPTPMPEHTLPDAAPFAQDAPVQPTPTPELTLPDAAPFAPVRPTPMPEYTLPGAAPFVPAASVAPIRPTPMPGYAPPGATPVAPLAQAPLDDLSSARASRPRSRVAMMMPWIAAATCLSFAVGTWWWHRERTPGAAVAMSAADARTALLGRGTDVTTTAWTRTADPAAKAAAGDVVWSDREQKGYLRFVGLEPNDPAAFQYQVWIFDKNRDERFPVDGGAFDVSSTGEVVIPIAARLPVGEAISFSVTVEKPGGVVVSGRQRVVVTAARKS